MQLFENFERTFLGRTTYSESSYGYLNRSARKEAKIIRNMISDWFNLYPENDKKELHARFTSGNDSQFYSAYFELFLFTFLTKLGDKIGIHPNLPNNTNKRPDFYGVSKDLKPYYLEAALAKEMSDEDAAVDNSKNRLFDSINEIVSPDFFIGIDSLKSSNSSAPLKKIKKFILSKIGALDANEMEILMQKKGLERLPRWTFKSDGWIIEFYPIPKSKNSRGASNVNTLGAVFEGTRWFDYSSSIKNTIKKKASKYGELNIPYLIAVNALDLGVDEVSLMEALFGKEQFIFERSTGKHIDTKRNNKGALVNPKLGMINTRISGILFCQKLTPWKIPESRIRLFHNPWAKIQYEGSLCLLPQAIPVNGEMKLSDGISHTELLDIRQFPV